MVKKKNQFFPPVIFSRRKYLYIDITHIPNLNTFILSTLLLSYPTARDILKIPRRFQHVAEQPFLHINIY